MSAGGASTETTSSATGPAMATGVADSTSNHQPESSTSDAPETKNEEKSLQDSVKKEMSKGDSAPSHTTSSAPPAEEKGAAKVENVWHDVTIVKSTSFTVNHYMEKIDSTLQVDFEASDSPNKVRLKLGLHLAKNCERTLCFLDSVC